jgi:hypothetical protein
MRYRCIWSAAERYPLFPCGFGASAATRTVGRVVIRLSSRCGGILTFAYMKYEKVIDPDADEPYTQWSLREKKVRIFNGRDDRI